MKKNLLVKLNDVIVDVSSGYEKAIKKSIEFFLGEIIDLEINDLTRHWLPSTRMEFIQNYLNEKNVFLREKPILKKFNEFYSGKEFVGFIKESSLLTDIKQLSALSKKYNIVLLSLMPPEETLFIQKLLSLENFRSISSESVEEGIMKGNDIFKSKFTYLGNSLSDYQVALKANVSFIGLNIDEEQVNSIKNIKELF